MSTKETDMSDRSVRRRMKRWSGRGGALRYHWYERLGDWWCATRDARSGLPVTPAAADPGPVGVPSLAVAAPVHPDGERRVGTPRTLLLGQLGRGRAEREWIRYQAETADLQVARKQAEVRGETADEQRVRAEDRLRALGDGPSEKERAMVAPGEENAAEGVAAGRRDREHAARRKAVQAEIDRCQSTAEAARVEASRLDEQIRIRRRVAEVRVAMIEAYVRRRCSAYLTRLVRKHPDGERIGALLRHGWSEQPSWLAGAGA